MPVYKSSEFITDAVRGALNQTYYNFELIIIDDNDNDSCYTKISSFRDTRIRYFRGKKEGIAGARNYAIEFAKGNLIANMDADDVYHPSRFEKQINFLYKNNLQICGSWMKCFGQGGRVLEYPVSDSDIKFALLYSSPIANPTVLGFTELFKKNYYRDSFCEDYDLWARLSMQGVRMGNIPEVLTHYRVHSDQTSSIKYPKMISDSIKVAEQYSFFFNTAKAHQILKRNNFLFDDAYSLEESKAISITLIEVSKGKALSQNTMLEFIYRCYTRLETPNLSSLLVYLHLLWSNDIPIFQRKNMIIFAQSLFRFKRTGFIYTFFKKYH